MKAGDPHGVASCQACACFWWARWEFLKSWLCKQHSWWLQRGIYFCLILEILEILAQSLPWYMDRGGTDVRVTLCTWANFHRFFLPSHWIPKAAVTQTPLSASFCGKSFKTKTTEALSIQECFLFDSWRTGQVFVCAFPASFYLEVKVLYCEKLGIYCPFFPLKVIFL